MTVVHKGKKSAGRQLVSTNARRAVSGSRYISFPYEAVERAILAVTNELTPDFFAPAADRAAVQKAEANLAELEGRIAKIKNTLVDGDGADYSEQLEVLQRLVGKRRAWRAELDGLSAARHTPAADNLKYTQQVIAQLDTLTGEELTALRGKLQSRFRTLIEGIEMLTVARGTRRRAYMHVHYQGGGLRLVIADVQQGKFVSSWGWGKQLDKPNVNFDFHSEKGIREIELFGTSWLPWGMSGKTK
jgi:hypothetical protein